MIREKQRCWLRCKPRAIRSLCVVNNRSKITVKIIENDTCFMKSKDVEKAVAINLASEKIKRGQTAYSFNPFRSSETITVLYV